MIFENYRKLINYVISHYPYEKIISYSKDLDYKWVIFNKKTEIVDIRFPTKWDIVKNLVFELSALCYNDLLCKAVRDTEDNVHISKIFTNYRQSNSYVNVRLRRDRKALYVRYKFHYIGRFCKFSLPMTNSSRYFNWRTDVVFIFSGDNEII